jgi:hypothetical protein
MKLLQSLFLICLILFTNLNIFIYQNWCQGENIGYTINSKKFHGLLKTFPNTKEVPSFKKDNCCKDVLIKSKENFVFSFEKTFQLAGFNLVAIRTDFTVDLTDYFFNQKIKIPQLYSNHPPERSNLYQLYCRYTYYG